MTVNEAGEVKFLEHVQVITNYKFIIVIAKNIICLTADQKIRRSLVKLKNSFYLFVTNNQLLILFLILLKTFIFC